MDERKERLFRAIGGVGSDLIDTAERRIFVQSLWRKWLPVAACLAVLAGLSALVLPKLQDHSSPGETSAPPAAETETLPNTEQQSKPEEPPRQEQTTEPPAENKEDQSLWAQSREAVIFLDTIYYAEADYSRQEAENLLGNQLGLVTGADDPALEGAAVYAKKDCAFRIDDQGLTIPLEIFVALEDGYRYCLTYYASAGPLMTHQEAYRLWFGGQLYALSGRLAEAMEIGRYFAAPMADYGDAADLTANQLFDFFLRTLAMEQASLGRTEDLDRYLWYRDDLDRYVIPVADVQAQLDKYLEGHAFVPAQCAAYDPQRNALVVEVLPEPREDLAGVCVTPVEATAYDETARRLTLVVDCLGGEEPVRREYVIRFTDTGCIYESILSRRAE